MSSSMSFRSNFKKKKNHSESHKIIKPCQFLVIEALGFQAVMIFKLKVIYKHLKNSMVWSLGTHYCNLWTFGWWLVSGYNLRNCFSPISPLWLCFRIPSSHQYWAGLLGQTETTIDPTLSDGDCHKKVHWCCWTASWAFFRNFLKT